MTLQSKDTSGDRIISLLTCKRQKVSEEFTLLFPGVKCPFIALHTHSCFATRFSTSRVHNLSHLHLLLFWTITSLPVEELLNADRTLQRRTSHAECATISKPTANRRLTQIPQNMVRVCEILEYLSSQDCFYNPVIAPYLVGRIC